MKRWQDRSLAERVDGAILNSGVARFLRSWSAVRRQSAGRPAFRRRVWVPAIMMGVALLAAMIAVAVPACVLPALFVLVLVNIAAPVFSSGSAFVPPDERELAVQRAGNSAGYIATAVIAMTGFFILMAQSLLDIRSLHQVGYEAALFLLSGCMTMTTVPRLYEATQYRGEVLEE
ncbi:hypothetical protein GOB93_16785 [Acetobacter musti]|uniref:Uncharacterized protein n=1 Tax=Acetobacter musti TaxID=864732 RepID=A0ABX0JSJ9_9PROT|nr:hypothetical protein [Acetobacter musti]NHN86282.1 hypothetical protein [Acetobacter musti]